jgi:two-component system phosphate regulon response regulator PhoB
MDKILIVDDRPEVQELLQVTLEIGDYRILFADDGWQALRIAREEQPDIILLDIMMPDSDIDGLEVCRRLRVHPVTTNTPIILLSAKGRKDDIEAGMAAGANDYVTKPFSPIDLLGRIERELRRRNNPFMIYDLAL